MLWMTDRSNSDGHSLIAALAPIGGGAGGPCYPYIGFMQYMENGSSSQYNGLQVTLTQKAWKGVNVLAGYTWRMS